MKDSVLGGLMFLGLMVIVMFLAVLVTNGTIQSKSGRTYIRQSNAGMPYHEWYATQSSWMAQQDTAKWNAFLECSKYEGDAGCDSCFTAIYGYSLER